jgi:nucleotide-binding universal stress UspA family protein
MIMPSNDILVAYNATDEAADGLALARLLADRLGHELLVTRVRTGGGRGRVLDLAHERDIRATVAETRRAIIAAQPDAGDVEILAIDDGEHVAASIHEVARAQDAVAIVTGSSHLSGIGRVLLGGSPELIANGAPCPVLVAPPGFRDNPAVTPKIIGVAYDGTASAAPALRFAAELAERLCFPLRVIAVRATGAAHPIERTREVGAALSSATQTVAELTGGRVETDAIERHGSPIAELIAETDGEVGLLVVGSHDRAPLQRVVVGSVAAGVLRGAKAPVAVVPA